MATDRGVAPELASRTGDSFLVQGAGDGARANSGGKLTENPSHDTRLGFIDLAIATNGVATGIQLLDDVVAEAEPAA
ncbi:hypothetical protein [Brucella pseudogrignonensis]|uniref:hypothetical protein n=1 Tax=Brucella pseudogrignonensis TaxID=419475 RepID=UPI001F35BCEE|nr:hypothetical protein [Brucella pseudogrignonensis]